MIDDALICRSSLIFTSFTTLSSIISLNNIFFCSSGENSLIFTDSNLKFFTSSSSRFLYSRIILGDKTLIYIYILSIFFSLSISMMVGPDETESFPIDLFSSKTPSDFILSTNSINAGVPTTLSSSVTS